MQKRFGERCERLRRQVRKTGAQAMLVTDFINVTYLTGFTGDDSYLLLREDGVTVLSDPRYTTQLEEQCPEVDLLIRQPGTSMLEALRKVLESAKVSRLAIEGDSMTVSLRDRLVVELRNLEIVPTSGLVERLRRIKDKEEIAQIREAIRYAEKGFGVLRATLGPEKTEKQIADELEYRMRQFGARGCGFPSIVAVGARSALPHAQPGGKDDRF